MYLCILNKSFYLPSILECQIVACELSKRSSEFSHIGSPAPRYRNYKKMDTSELPLLECELEAGTVCGYWVPMARETLPQILGHHLSLPVFLSVSYFFLFNIATASSSALHITDRQLMKF